MTEKNLNNINYDLYNLLNYGIQKIRDDFGCGFDVEDYEYIFGSDTVEKFNDIDCIEENEIENIFGYGGYRYENEFDIIKNIGIDNFAKSQFFYDSEKWIYYSFISILFKHNVHYITRFKLVDEIDKYWYEDDDYLNLKIILKGDKLPLFYFTFLYLPIYIKEELEYIEGSIKKYGNMDLCKLRLNI